MNLFRKLKNKNTPEINKTEGINNNNLPENSSDSASEPEVTLEQDFSAISNPEDTIDSETTDQLVITDEPNSIPSDTIPDENVEEEPEPAPSLLQNGPFIKLVEELCEIMKEFDGYSNRVQTEEAKIIVNQILEQLQESLERSGLTRFENENTYSILRHIPVPMAKINEGETISETLSPGLSIENRIFRKAKVKIFNK